MTFFLSCGCLWDFVRDLKVSARERENTLGASQLTKAKFITKASRWDCVCLSMCDVVSDVVYACGKYEPHSVYATRTRSPPRLTNGLYILLLGYEVTYKRHHFQDIEPNRSVDVYVRMQCSEEVKFPDFFHLNLVSPGSYASQLR